MITKLFLCTALVAISCQAGDPPPVAQVFRAGAGAHEGQGITVGADGHIYATGQFAGTADFGGLTLTNGGSFDYFISAYDATGHTLWAKRAGGTGADFGADVIVDSAGKIVVTGVFQGSVDFHGTTLTGVGDKDWFLAKYTATGELLWARSAGSPNADQAYDVAVDGDGNYLVAGRISHVANFGGTTVGAASQNRYVLAKYDKDGNVIWVRDAGETDGTTTAGVAADSAGNSYITGLLQTSGAGPFVAKYNPAGTQLWRFVAGTGFTYFEEGSGVDVDEAGNVYVAGRFSAASITFGQSTLENPSGFPTGFIAKFDNAGVPLWAVKAGARGFDVDVTKEGVYATGFYSANARAIGGETPTVDTALETYIAKFSPEGATLWVKPSEAFGGGPGRAVVKVPGGGVFAIGESGAELFDVGTFPGGVFIVELNEAVEPAGPSLSIGIIGNKLQLTWPESFSNYSIETAARINAAFGPATVELTPVPGQPNGFTLPLPDTALFFRLKK